MLAWLQIDVFVKNTSTVPSFQMAHESCVNYRHITAATAKNKNQFAWL